MASLATPTINSPSMDNCITEMEDRAIGGKAIVNTLQERTINNPSRVDSTMKLPSLRQRIRDFDEIFRHFIYSRYDAEGYFIERLSPELQEAAEEESRILYAIRDALPAKHKHLWSDMDSAQGHNLAEQWKVSYAQGLLDGIMMRDTIEAWTKETSGRQGGATCQ